ncbi:MAG TPA: exodeoxyribonuclease V subunit beta [Macromonas sp.]|nr:exodeoxyribonuclease V subunit beta [Macromonas sp.]
MNPSVQALDVFALPLQGRQVIEASAGTGKTWTLAALYLRLVLGVGRAQPLLPPQILVMTFTEAATAELRQRIRDRLAEACAYFRDQLQCAPDGFLQALRAIFPPADWPACAHRLDLAAQWMDDAAIFTIHGWSHRMLREHAFESRSLFEQHAVDDGATLWRAVAQDYWRQTYYPLSPEAAALVESVVADPDDLLQKTQAVRDQAERSPQPQDDEPAAPGALLAEAADWQRMLEQLQQPARAAWLAWIPAGREALQQAAASKQLPNYARWLAGWLEKMDAWAGGERIDSKTLGRFTLVALQEKWKNPPDLSTLAPLDALQQHLDSEPDITPTLLEHAAWALRQTYAERKAELAQFDFNDLLQRLYHAVRAPDGTLAQAIRRQYPVALVDEFQDTDPWQYGALDAIYPNTPENTGTALVMIGDPKQAIYSFRGADLATYLKARNEAQGIHTLDGNHRSTPALVDALNHVFTLADRPFGDIAYPPVQACRQNLPPLRNAHGQDLPALTVWHTPFDTPLNAAQASEQMAEAFASQMVALLQQGVAQPQDMAVLVRSGREAAQIRQALARRGVKSVYLSERNSIFATAEAQDLWRLLRAVLEPRRADLLRAALACQAWGWPLQEVASLQADETRWEAWLERFLAWQNLWRSQGVLPMLYRWLHEAQIASRLLQQDPVAGERRLTNLLQLGEWLQHVATTLHGEAALLRHFENHLRRPELGGESAQLRLESDDELVKVVTMHKSKGLQYPLVFLPFVSHFHSARGESADSDDGDDQNESPVAEDIRLLYVALTRAERGLWLGVAARTKEFTDKHPQGQSALSHLLGRQSADDLAQRLALWAQHLQIWLEPLPAPSAERYLGNAQPLQHHPARQPQRRLSSHWWTASFSSLARPQAGAPTSDGWAEERWLDAQCDQALTQDLVVSASPYNTFPAGSRYGTLLHDLLEWQAREGWPLARQMTLAEAAAAPQAQQAAGRAWQAWLSARCESVALPPEAQAQLEPWLQRLLTQSLPLTDGAAAAAAGLALADLTPVQLWPEMAFTLPAQATPAPWLDQQIQHQLWPGQPRLPLAPRTLNGMLTGFMDLVFEHQGRFHVLDYKSNKLPHYGHTALVEAMLEHRYDVQLSLYLLALHRLLRARLPGYDYDQHVGGAVYLFLRGIDAPGAGTVYVKPPRALIEALDARLRGEGA